MRDLFVYVADGNMAEAVGGLLDRKQKHLALGCAHFTFDSRTDIKVAKGQNDPGVYTRADELMRPFAADYQHAVVIVDEAWDGSPGAAAIEARLQDHLIAAGWLPAKALALVVSPEADVWLWTQTDHTACALGWSDWTTLQAALAQTNHWSAGQHKPPHPKEAAEWALRRGPKRIPRSSKLYRQVSEKVALRRCADPALATFIQQLQTWFPLPEGA
jgi:hypothetical protein